jgi:hypothetical protein
MPITPEAMHTLFHAPDPTTAAEVARLVDAAHTDPHAARNLIQVVYSLSVEDPAAAMLLRLHPKGTREGLLLRQIQARAAQDDAYALACAELITGRLEQLAPPERGRPKPKRA